MSSSNQIKKILILSANPKGTPPLRLAEEVREIDTALRQAKNRDQFVLEQRWAVRYGDVQKALLDIEPHIVHFSGHGAGEAGLVFEDEIGQAKLIDAEALTSLFNLFAHQVECVVLNACYSEVQAEAILEHIKYVIGMSQAIGDKAAIEYSVGFYYALASGQSIEFAHKSGCVAIKTAGIAESLTPVMKTKNTLDNVSSNSELLESQASNLKQTSLLANEPIEVFFSYAHEDEELKDQLIKHLSMLRRQGIIRAWHDREITAGIEWAGEIDQHLESARIILLLISPAFIDSDYCYDVELQRAMERHETREARVIPIIIKPTDWNNAPFRKLQALPRNAQPVTTFSDRDEAFLNVAQGIRKATEDLAKTSI